MSDNQVIGLCLTAIGLLIILIGALIKYIVSIEKRMTSAEIDLRHAISTANKNDTESNTINKTISEALHELSSQQRVTNNTLDAIGDTLLRFEKFTEKLSDKQNEHDTSIQVMSKSIKVIEEQAKKYVTN